MLDERLGRRSVLAASLGLIPALVVLAVFADGITNPGVSRDRLLVWTVISIPPLAAFVLGLLTGYRVLRAVALAGASLLMIGVWYAVLLLPGSSGLLRDERRQLHVARVSRPMTLLALEPILASTDSFDAGSSAIV